MAETLATGPPAPGALSLDTAYLSNNFASLAGTNTAIQAGASDYSYSAYSYSAPGGTVAVSGLDQSALNGANNSDKTGWNALSDTVKYVIYAAAGVVALAIIGIIIWLSIRSSRKRKQEARQNARLTTRSSFASPMHERETMQPQSAATFNFNDPHGTSAMGGNAAAGGGGEYEKSGGVYRTETNYTHGSMEKIRGGVYADAQSVHSIPPSYQHNQRNNNNSNGGFDNYHAGDMSGATLLNASTASHGSGEDGNTNANGQPVHHMLTGVNTGLSSFKPVPPPGTVTAAMPRVDEPSYPPRMQSQNAMMGQERSATPLSARGQQSPQQYQQQQQPSRQQYYQQDEYQQQYQNRNPSSNQQQPSYSNNNRHVPPSPAYSQATSGSGRSRHEEPAYATPQESFFTPREGTPTTPNAPVVQQPSQAASATGAGAGHRYRMPPQSRSQRAQSPPVVNHNNNHPAAVYHNPYAAFAQDEQENLDSYPAGQGDDYADYRNDGRQQQQQPQYRQQRQEQQQYQQQQQQQEPQQYDTSDSYFPAQTRHQPQQQSYSAPYNNYRQY